MFPTCEHAAKRTSFVIFSHAENVNDRLIVPICRFLLFQNYLKLTRGKFHFLTFKKLIIVYGIPAHSVFLFIFFIGCQNEQPSKVSTIEFHASGRVLKDRNYFHPDR